MSDPELRERIASVMADHAQTPMRGFREGDHDPDYECPWGMKEMDWPGYADAVLAVLDRETLIALLGAEQTAYKDERDEAIGLLRALVFAVPDTIGAEAALLNAALFVGLRDPAEEEPT